ARGNPRRNRPTRYVFPLRLFFGHRPQRPRRHDVAHQPRNGELADAPIDAIPLPPSTAVGVPLDGVQLAGSADVHVFHNADVTQAVAVVDDEDGARLGGLRALLAVGPLPQVQSPARDAE